MCYLDTSVLAAYYSPEPLSSKVQQTLRELSEPTLSPLVELELHSALAIKVRSRELDAATAGQIASMFQLHQSDGLYRIVPIGLANTPSPATGSARSAPPSARSTPFTWPPRLPTNLPSSPPTAP